ncbi:MAG: Bug family tripartite tricarboxylate transporter substrate binding protein [Pseudorhodoplanes sp.]|uniref:Bug family tripartite tricarboxylate transporter substrate binding protein n=1 Tax=Pseudorhodoplanes sp. TaxID=1934341 RepID=UPI003D0BDC10
MSNSVHSTIGITLLALLALVMGRPAHAFPERPVTLVVPFAAGGPADLIGRKLGETLSKTLGQRVIIENVTGAGGTIGSARVMNAPPDGYTMLLGHIGTHGAAPALYNNLSYDPAKDFTPVAMIGSTPMVLLVKKSEDKNTLASFRELAKSKGDRLTFSHGGVGSISHLACTMLLSDLGIKATPVGYRGNGPALQDLIAGQVDFMCDAVSTARPHIESGAVKPVMMLSNPTSGTLPAPAAKDAGSNIDVVAWYALFLPKNVDEKVRGQIEKALSDALDNPDLRSALEQTGTTTSAKDQRQTDYVRQFVGSEVDRWKKVLPKVQ